MKKYQWKIQFQQAKSIGIPVPAKAFGPCLHENEQVTLKERKRVSRDFLHPLIPQRLLVKGLQPYRDKN
jgi:hypothetical protein